MSTESRSTLEGVCSLEPPDLQTRLARIRREITPHVRARVRLPDGMAYELADAPGLRADTEAILALERQCCSSLDFRLTPGRDGLRLEIRGMAPDSDFFDVIGGAAAPPETGGVRRFAQAGGLGAITAFVLFCGVPIALAAAAGSAVAAPLAGLDDPRWIGAGSLVFGGAAWWWLRRRAAGRRVSAGASAGAASDDGCGC